MISALLLYSVASTLLLGVTQKAYVTQQRACAIALSV